MLRTSPGRTTRLTGLLLGLAAAPCVAQQPAPAAPAATPAPPPATAAHPAHAATADTLPAGDVAALARLVVAIAQVRDSTQKQLSLVRNKTPQAQQQLRAQAATQVTALLRQAKLTDAEYRRRTYLVSSDSTARRAFDATVARLTGAPLPAQGATVASAPPAATAAPPALPGGPLGTHLGHLLEAFAETPMGRGLIPTALAEARTAAVHAGLAARDANDLAAMKLHAGHVLHAVDPTAAASGPGLGYGVKRAALAVAAHAGMAGSARGAQPQVPTHAGHVATAANNTVRRADAIVAVGRRIQAASTAAEAAALTSQLVALATELTDGRDANADGKVDTSEAESGLHLADEHARLLAAGR